MFFVSDQGSGSEQQVKAGPGLVTPPTSGRDSPDSKREARRSFFGRRDASGKQDPPKE
ncbi:hypothetical protein LPUS_08263 [Lasallia pustulata]|uniref:Uncharacterized protein n=1 Tax=Lasallia pustulata TaxID=136370 RepID=A0A1W5D4T2_9LECA|nr:hypothetical protein LPUS_08263 [Lasallia pustulata]